MKKQTVMLLLPILALMISGCNTVVNKMAFFPNKVTISPNKLPQGVKEVFIKTKDGIKIQSYFIPDKHSKKLVIFFHGNAGNISHRLSDLIQINQFDTNVLGVGYRGYGKSEGKPSEKGIYLDGEAAIDYAIHKLGFTINNIYIFGRSIGTTVAINIAQHKNIAGLILVSPLTSGKEQAKTTSLKFISFLAGTSFNNIDKVQNIISPVLIIHGTYDRIVPYKMGVEIYNKIKTKKKLITIVGAGHNNICSNFFREYWLPIQKFIKSENL